MSHLANLPLTIAQLGHPVLRQTAQAITDPQDQTLQALIDRLITTLTQSKGVGIAAPQVSESLRLVIIASHPNERYPHAPQMEPMALLNPTIVDRSDRTLQDWEGCLSVPGLRGLVPRSQWVEVTYLDREGRSQHQRFEEFVARIVQHELDHLEGNVFLDRVETSRDLMTEQEWLNRVVKVANS
jgi:peptide deformylase